MAASNTRFTQNSLGQSKTPIDSDHGIYRYKGASSSRCSAARRPRGRSHAQTYPSRPITLVVPYPPGGGVDAMGRMVAQKLSLALGQQFIIENRAGAGGVIGTRAAAKATPDGYTLVMMVTLASLPANAGYDLGKDFAPVGLIASTPI